MDEQSTAKKPMIIEGCCCSSSSSSRSNDNKRNIVEILNNRLEVLEQEAAKMKNMLVVCMYERREIITEIMQLFQTLRTHIHGSEMKHPLNFYQASQHQNIGLLQALWEDSNPFLVLRGSTKANIIR
ncbi:uncharacterized protein [Spinacia oleracea]|uniref:Uncharacterized protein n=1 Tax=Spinacia oleracea TaxID=3562 RepID=A0ABM3RRJ6_SPIOL|nr:uncharacterized protein LOC130471914 [Spinacia oleracea]